VEEKPLIVPDKPAKSEKPVKNEKNEKNEKTEKSDKAVKVDKPAKIEPPAPKVTPPAVKAEKIEKVETAPTFGVQEIESPARSGKGMKLIVAAAASIALFVALFVYPGFLRTNSKPTAPAAAHQDSSPLQLRVERAAGELMLTWNPDSDAIRNASKAVLAITDGDQHQNVDMDLALLASGKVMYSPSGTDISFKMEVLDKAQKKTTSESVRMLRNPSPLQEQNDAAAKSAAAAAGTKPAAGAAPAGTTPDGEEAAVAEQPKPVTPLKAFKSESLGQRLRPAAPTDMPDAPTVNTSHGAAASAIPGVNMNAAAPAPFVPPPPAPAPPAASAPVEPKPKSGGQIQQAVLIYRKDAEYPKIAKQTGAKGTVTLTATIGKDGNVKAVKVVSGHPMLVGAASEAVKQWRYRPTLLNGQPVETETQVLVNFLGER
jgi:protein TonB